MSSEQVELSQPQEDPPRFTAALAPLIPITEIEPNLDEPRKQPFMGTGTTMSDPADCNRMPSIGSDGSIGQFSNSYQSAPVSHNASKQFPARGANTSDYSFISPIQENGTFFNLSRRIVDDSKMVKDGMTVDGVSTVSGVVSNSSVKMTRSTSFQRESTASNTSYSGYPNSSQTNVEGQHSSSRRSSLLHKRYARRNDTAAPSDFIQSTNLEEMALTTDIPQWLMYTWTTKLKDTSMSDKRAQEVIAETLILKQYMLPVTLCDILPGNQHDSIARNLLIYFHSIHTVLRNDVHNFTTAATASTMLPDQSASNSLQRNVSNSAEVTQQSQSGSSGTVSLTTGAVATGSQSVLSMQNQNTSVASKLGSSESSRLSRPRRRDHLIGFLEELIKKEVLEARSDASLFRSNNTTSKLLNIYVNSIGKQYLKTMLSNVIEQVMTMGSLEVDPLKLSPQISVDPTTGKPIDAGATERRVQAEIDENMSKLLAVVRSVVEAVIASVESCPIGIKKVSILIQKHVERKFHGKGSVGPGGTLDRRPRLTSNSSSQNIKLTTKDQFALPPSAEKKSALVLPMSMNHHVAVRGFIFLRFICPAIVSPEQFGLVKGPLSSRQRRNLILVSKVVQNIASGVRFGGKESYMIPCNSAVDEHEPAINDYCDCLQSLDYDSLYYVSLSGTGGGPGTDELSLSDTNNSRPPKDSTKPTEESVSQILVGEQPMVWSKGRSPSWETSMLHVVNAIYTHMTKLFERMKETDDTLQEHMTYSVVAALKAILHRLTAVEKDVLEVTASAGGSELNAHEGEIPRETFDSTQTNYALGGMGNEEDEFSLTKKDDPMLKQIVLLGGLEEVLLMNEAVLLKALLSPRYYTQRLAINASNPATRGSIHREMDATILASIQVLAPHGAKRVVSLLHWICDQEKEIEKDGELKEGEEILQSYPNPSSPLTHTRDILPSQQPSSPTSPTSIRDQLSSFRSAISTRFVVSFLLSAARHFMPPLLMKIEKELKTISESVEIDPSLNSQQQAEGEDEVDLKPKLDALAQAALRVLDVIQGESKGLPLYVCQVLSLLHQRWFTPVDKEEGDKQQQQEEKTATDLVLVMLINRIFYPTLATPSQYGIPTSTRRSRPSSLVMGSNIQVPIALEGQSLSASITVDSSQIQQPVQEHPQHEVERKRALTSAMLRYLCTRLTAEPHVEQDTNETEWLLRFKDGWTQVTDKLMKALLESSEVSGEKLSVDNNPSAGDASSNKIPSLTTHADANLLGAIPIVLHDASGTQGTLSSNQTKQGPPDEVLFISPGSRSRGLWTLRKILHRPGLKRLKALIDTHIQPYVHSPTLNPSISLTSPCSNYDTSTSIDQSMSMNFQAPTSITDRKVMLNGVRSHKVKYHLMDRVRVVFWCIYTQLEAAQGQPGMPGAGVEHGSRSLSGTLERKRGTSTITAAAFLKEENSTPQLLNSKAKRGFLASAIKSDVQYNVHSMKSSSATKSTKSTKSAKEGGSSKLGSKENRGLFGRKMVEHDGASTVSAKENGTWSALAGVIVKNLLGVKQSKTNLSFVEDEAEAEDQANKKKFGFFFRHAPGTGNNEKTLMSMLKADKERKTQTTARQ